MVWWIHKEMSGTVKEHLGIAALTFFILSHFVEKKNEKSQGCYFFFILSYFFCLASYLFVSSSVFHCFFETQSRGSREYLLLTNLLVFFFSKYICENLQYVLSCCNITNNFLCWKIAKNENKTLHKLLKLIKVWFISKWSYLQIDPFRIPSGHWFKWLPNSFYTVLTSFYC